ncbi:MAG: hypothetical protein QXT25_04705 [Candidatus Anstonellaceae archaeon]
MACFIVPTVIGGIIYKLGNRLPQSLHPEWLGAMSFGGALGLTVEHIIHGEIVPWPPFFTAASSPQSLALMLEEMLFVGVPMAFVLILAWLALAFASSRFSQYQVKKAAQGLH